MSPVDFRYLVEHKTPDGDTLRSRFLNFESAIAWARRLKTEGMECQIYHKPEQSVEFVVMNIEIRKMRKDVCRTSKPKTAPSLRK